ncbi:hypothetical protein ACWGN9_15125 [Streptomyces sp. NPDC055775]
MDSAWIGIVGTVAGGVVAAVPALISAHWTRSQLEKQLDTQIRQNELSVRANHLQHRREPRGKAYAEYVSKTLVIHDAMRSVFDKFTEDSNYGVEYPEIDEIAIHVTELRTLWARVTVEGPEHVVLPADNLQVRCGRSLRLLRRTLRLTEAQMERHLSQHTKLPFDTEDLTELNDAVQNFMEAARRALDDDGIAHVS